MQVRNLTNIQIINRFLDGAVTGSNKKGSLYIVGDRLFSYGPHFPLAKRDPALNAIIVNNRKYSITTAHHKSRVIRMAETKGLDVQERDLPPLS